MTRRYDKLVRDEMPAVIRADGEHPVTHVADDEEYERRLREKLIEEATEYREDGSLDELADVTGVLLAVCEHRGVSLAELRERAKEGSGAWGVHRGRRAGARRGDRRDRGAGD